MLLCANSFAGALGHLVRTQSAYLPSRSEIGEHSSQGCLAVHRAIHREDRGLWTERLLSPWRIDQMLLWDIVLLSTR